MRVVTIAAVELQRLLRDRSNLFFVFVLPLLLVIFIGAQFGEGATQRQVGVVAPDDDPAAAELVDAIAAVDGFVTVPAADEQAVVDDVARGNLTAGLVISDGYGERLDRGEDASVGYIGRADATARSVRSIVEAAVAEQAAVVAAARLAGDALGRPAAELVGVAGGIQTVLPEVRVTAEQVGADELAQEFAGLGQFDLGASSQLFLFVFLTSLTSGAALIQTRQLGIARRMLSTPSGVGVILGGQAAGRYLVALAQAGYIIAATWLLFGVNWGDPIATGAVVLLFGLVAAGAGMLIGSVLRNDSQAAGVGVGIGLVMAALGGSMAPLEIFPPAMHTVARGTPHAWANEAMAEIVRRDGGLLDVLPQVGVLAGYALLLLIAATILLRRTLTR